VRGRVSITLPDDLLKRIDRIPASRSAFIETILEIAVVEIEAGFLNQKFTNALVAKWAAKEKAAKEEAERQAREKE
jgi:metal-responsive CopG/Arc/MetJ family transcriptional regulator